MTHILANPDLLSTAPATDTSVDLSDFQLRLASSSLHAPLDLHEALATFYQHLHKMIRCSGMEYQLAERDIRLALGTRRAHTATYNLRNGQDGVGEMTFFRGTRFSEQELSTLESLLAMLMQPLSSALRVREAV